MDCTILSSPLQSFTDFRFRNAFQQCFGGVDIFYAPYIRLNGKFVIKPAYQLDIAHKNNTTLEVIPQVMTGNADEFLFVTKYIQSLGYKELNWNLGCPYPMVINKGMGSGLICDPTKIDHILKRVHNETDVVISMKMRMGYENAQEILHAFPILNKYPLKNIAIHARIGKQLYKGGVDLESFGECFKHTNHTLYYNGDITTVEGFRQMKDRFPQIQHWMIGRGLISDPFLPQMIKDDSTEYPDDRLDIFNRFHDMLSYQFEQKLKGEKHVIMKMLSYWEYFAQSFHNTNKVIKSIKKTKTLEEYHNAVQDIFKNELEATEYQ